MTRRRLAPVIFLIFSFLLCLRRKKKRFVSLAMLVGLCGYPSIRHAMNVGRVQFCFFLRFLSA